jgi:5'-methylthioadenosine phosphorylase
VDGLKREERDGGAVADESEAALGVVGSFGVGQRLARRADAGVETRTIVTAFGSVELVEGAIDGGRFVAVEKSQAAAFAPHNLPYRAVATALRRAGATRVISASVGTALSDRVRVGDIVLPSDFLDFTGRTVTLYGGGIEGTHHAEMDHPFCARLTRDYASVARGFALRVKEGGTVATVQGPHHPTAAESEWLASFGAQITSFTAATEAKLARELGMCFAATVVAVRSAAAHPGWNPKGRAAPAPAAGEPTEAQLLRAFAQGQDPAVPGRTALAEPARAALATTGRKRAMSEETMLVGRLREADSRLEEAAAAFVAQAAALPPCPRCPRGQGPATA